MKSNLNKGKHDICFEVKLQNIDRKQSWLGCTHFPDEALTE